MMERDDLDQLIARWLAGDLTDAEEAQFLEALRADEGVRVRFVELADQDASLRVLAQSQAIAEQAKHEPDGVLAPGPRRAPTGRWRRRPRRQQAAFGAAAALAVAATVALVVWLASTPPTSPAPSRTPDRIAQRPRPEAQPTEAVRPDGPSAPHDGTTPRRVAETRVAPDDVPQDAETESNPPAPAVTVDRPPFKTPAAPPSREDVAGGREHIAYLDTIVGDVELSHPNRDGWHAAGQGAPVAVGDGVRTKFSRARLVLESGSVVLLNRFTTITFGRREAAPGFAMAGGEAYVDTAKRDAGFWVETPHGLAVDLGTRFGVDAKGNRTLVAVVEGEVEASTDEGTAKLDAEHEVLLVRRTSPPGMVRRVRNLQKRFAWTDEVGGGREPRVAQASLDEVVLLPKHGKITGTAWRLVRDPDASTGVAIEDPSRRLFFQDKDGAVQQDSSSYLTFVFQAHAGKDYRIWVRGRSMTAGNEEYKYDAAAIQLLTGVFTRPCQWISARGKNWGLADDFSPGEYGYPKPLASIRFEKTGRQEIRVYPCESPLRIDRIWISSRQLTAPKPDQIGPDLPPAR